jgi:hypothetical protein
MKFSRRKAPSSANRTGCAQICDERDARENSGSYHLVAQLQAPTKPSTIRDVRPAFGPVRRSMPQKDCVFGTVCMNIFKRLAIAEPNLPFACTVNCTRACASSDQAQRNDPAF